MENEQFTPDERALVERLGRAPQSSLSADAFEAIRLRVLDSVPEIMPTPTTPASPPVALFVVAVVVVVIVILAALVFSQQMGQVPPATSEPPAPTFTPVSSATATVVPTDVPTVTATLTTAPTITPAPTLTAVPSLTPAPASITTLQPILIIEGPIETIDGNQITIYDMTIVIDPDNPVQDVLEVGDVVHVEAGSDDDQPGVFIAIVIVVVNVDVTVNDSTGEVWRDDGSCANPPPPWAPANGWRRRCGGGAPPGNNGNGNNGQGNNGQGNSGNGNNGQGNNDDDNGGGNDDDD